jgi:hypothetical protein
MNYEKNNGKRRKLYTSIGNANHNINTIGNTDQESHDAVLASQIRNINKILKILEQSKVSCNDYCSIQQPFFSSDNNDNKFVINFQSLSNYNIPESLNRNIILIYKILGDPTKEIYLGEWTILSLATALDMYKDYCDNGQNNVFDIGYKYEGMGHVTVISCDLKSHLLFYRSGGGSNGYDREANYKNIIIHGSGNYQQFFFSKWFYNIFNN